MSKLCSFHLLQMIETRLAGVFPDFRNNAAGTSRVCILQTRYSVCKAPRAPVALHAEQLRHRNHFVNEIPRLAQLLVLRKNQGQLTRTEKLFLVIIVPLYTLPSRVLHINKHYCIITRCMEMLKIYNAVLYCVKVLVIFFFTTVAIFHIEHFNYFFKVLCAVQGRRLLKNCLLLSILTHFVVPVVTNAFAYLPIYCLSKGQGLIKILSLILICIIQ